MTQVYLGEGAKKRLNSVKLRLYSKSLLGRAPRERADGVYEAKDLAGWSSYEERK